MSNEWEKYRSHDTRTGWEKDPQGVQGTSAGTDKVNNSKDALDGIMNIVTTTQQADAAKSPPETTTIKVEIVDPVPAGSN